MLKNKYGSAYFEMSWPNKKIFMVFRDMQDNEYEIRYTPLTIARYSRLMESNPDDEGECLESISIAQAVTV